MGAIKLHRGDLAAIIQLVEKLNADHVHIHEDTSSGIGPTIEVRVPVSIEGYDGVFVKTIVDVDRW